MADRAEWRLGAHNAEQVIKQIWISCGNEVDIQTGAGENRLLDFIKRNLLATGPAVKTFELLHDARCPN